MGVFKEKHWLAYFFNIIDGRVLFYNLWNTKRRPWILFELFKNYLIKTQFLWIKSPSIYQSSTNMFFFKWVSVLFCFFAHFQNCLYVCFNVNNCKNLLARPINYMNIFILVWCFSQSIFYFASFFFSLEKRLSLIIQAVSLSISREHTVIWVGLFEEFDQSFQKPKRGKGSDTCCVGCGVFFLPLKNYLR